MVIAGLILSIVLEWLIYSLKPLWTHRDKLVVPPLVLCGFGTSAMIVAYPHWSIVFVVAISVFRVINHLRIAQGRMHDQYLRHSSRRTGLVLGLAQLVGIGVVLLQPTNLNPVINVYMAAQFALASLTLIITSRTIANTRFRRDEVYFADKELPSVTVAIPARNETDDLEQCLRSVLANDYPKLEIIVLDDCSQDKTADVIRSFAHAGVRFIKGEEPSDRWLAKNQAYSRLEEEATGELVLFCGVDVRFGPQAVRALVSTLLARNKSMLSVMPRRLTSEVLSVFVQPLRYWWELAVPRRLFNRPAVLSTCWLIRRKTLKKLGSFDAVSHSILPEGYFARELVKSDQYSFLRADDILDVQTRKTPERQRETAIRMRYPQIRRRPEIALLLTITHVFFMLAPLACFISSFWLGVGWIQTIGLISYLMLTATHVSIVQVSNPANVLTAALSYPLAILVELVISYISMFRYEFSEVNWKGRNVCIPVMHAIPKRDFLASLEKDIK